MDLQSVLDSANFALCASLLKDSRSFSLPVIGVKVRLITSASH